MGAQADDCRILHPPKRPFDYLAVAEKQLFQALAGNPAQLVNAAARIGLVPSKFPAPRALSADASAGPCRIFGVDPSREVPLHIGETACRRKVRLVRPDGRTKDEWLLRTESIAH